MGLQAKFEDGTEVFVTITKDLYSETLTALIKAGAVSVDYIAM
jgi:hypothetical protein